MLHDTSSHRSQWEPLHASRPRMLEALAQKLASAREAIIEVASEETALTAAELAPEFDRMVGTLRMFAQVLREGSWVRASIDTAPATDAQRTACIGPPHDVRRMLVPLGSRAGVFGASNFPLAYGVCGGDTASALAAGLAVIVKEHPAQPRTGRLLAQLAWEARVPMAYVVHEDPTDFRIAKDVVDVVDAVGLTGSVEGGTAVADLARARHIPAFCEMGSANLVEVGASCIETAKQREDLATLLSSSITARVGQQCTRPGIISVSSQHQDAYAHFAALLAARMDAVPARRMLSEHVAKRYASRIVQLRKAGCSVLTSRASALERQRDGQQYAVPMLLSAPGSQDLRELATGSKSKLVLDEVFGPAVLMVPAKSDANQLFARARLTTTLHGAPLAQSGLQAAGRVVFAGVPTGVRVCNSMVHSGLFPASNVPHTTAVGALAIERWCKLVCYQNAPQHALPDELRDENPRSIMRQLNGEWRR
jgi:alpha-ketoglutaric semialdehyde dehydrogenase